MLFILHQKGDWQADGRFYCQGWMVTPDAIISLRSIYGLMAKRNALDAQKPHQTRDLGISGIKGVSFPSIPEPELEDSGGCGSYLCKKKIKATSGKQKRMDPEGLFFFF